NGDFVGTTEALHAEESAGEVEGGGQASALEYRDAAAGFDEIEFAVETYALADAEPLVEIQQVGAAAQEDVLAVVDGLGDLFATGGNGVGGSAATQVGTGFM